MTLTEAPAMSPLLSAALGTALAPLLGTFFVSDTTLGAASAPLEVVRKDDSAQARCTPGRSCEAAARDGRRACRQRSHRTASTLASGELVRFLHPTVDWCSWCSPTVAQSTLRHGARMRTCHELRGGFRLGRSGSRTLGCATPRHTSDRGPDLAHERRFRSDGLAGSPHRPLRLRRECATFSPAVHPPPIPSPGSFLKDPARSLGKTTGISAGTAISRQLTGRNVRWHLHSWLSCDALYLFRKAVAPDLIGEPVSRAVRCRSVGNVDVPCFVTAPPGQ